MICKNCQGQGEVKEHNFDPEPGAPIYNIVTYVFCNGDGEVEENE